jgi:hypothetical protein
MREIQTDIVATTETLLPQYTPQSGLGNYNYQFQFSVKHQETHHTREIDKLLEHF